MDSFFVLWKRGTVIVSLMEMRLRTIMVPVGCSGLDEGDGDCGEAVK